MYILGISCFYHDSAAALIKDGEIIAAAEEERFSRKKHDSSFPDNAISYVLEEGNITISEVDYVAFYEKPFVKFERILETYLAYAPKGLRSYLKAIRIWVTKKLWIPNLIATKLGYEGEILYTKHHQSHAASAFFPSPFRESAIITVDGVGEWNTTTLGVGEGNGLDIQKKIDFPHSLGLLYSAFTYYLGFKVNSGEYKMMGLSSYGQPKYKDLIYEHLIDVKDDGSFRLNMEYFEFPVGLKMTNQKFADLFGKPRRQPEGELTQWHMDVAKSIQVVTEELMLTMAEHAYEQTDKDNLCLAGGTALNCVANGRLLRESSFDDIWIQPAAGDAGGALGTALSVWYEYNDNKREADNENDFQKGTYLGPEFSDRKIQSHLDEVGAVYEKIDNIEQLCQQTAEAIADKNVVGWYQGRMEYGPRALGNRSILADPRDKEMQQVVNRKIKFREAFRPFAPSVLAEHAGEYFDIDRESPYMLLVAQVADDKLKELGREEQEKSGVEKLDVERSEIPAVTHVDNSSRLQTVNKEDNFLYHELIDKFYEQTGCPIVINTSLNRRGEPIVCTPEDAFNCFMGTNMDWIVIGSFMLKKDSQPKELKEKHEKGVYEYD